MGVRPAAGAAKFVYADLIVVLRGCGGPDLGAHPLDAAISVCIEQASRRTDGPPLEPGLQLPVNSIRLFNAYGPLLRARPAPTAPSSASSFGRSWQAAPSTVARRHQTREYHTTPPTSPRRSWPPQRPNFGQGLSTSEQEIRSRQPLWWSSWGEKVQLPWRPARTALHLGEHRPHPERTRMRRRRSVSTRASGESRRDRPLAATPRWDPEFDRRHRDVVQISRNTRGKP